GIGGLSLGLPTLEAMLDANGTALADGSPLPTSYVVCYGGYSTGAGDGAHNVSNPQQFVPDREGLGYDLKRCPAPSAGFPNPRKNNEPIRTEMSIVSGLLIPWGAFDETDWSKLPLGGKPANFHGYTPQPQLTGVRTDKSASYNGPSSDELV